MAAFKPIDPKRDEFRRYLERTGVVEALTKVFVRLIRERERPDDPLQYLRSNMGDRLQQDNSIAYLQGELAEARANIRHLREIIERVDPEALQEAYEDTNQGKLSNGVAAESSLPSPTNDNLDAENNLEANASAGNVMETTAVTAEVSTAGDEAQPAETSKGSFADAVNNCPNDSPNSSDTVQSCVDEPLA